MAVVTCNGKSFTCNKAIKGTDYVHLIDASGVMIAAFDGVSDFSVFSISGGSWTSPTATTENSVAVVKEDGTTGKCGVPLKNFYRSGHTMLLTKNIHYGSALPSSGTEGQVFFLIV